MSVPTAEQWDEIVKLANRANFCREYRDGTPALLTSQEVCQHVVCDLVRRVLIADLRLRIKPVKL